MEHKNLTSPPEPITTRAAHNGLYVSLYLSMLVVAMGFSLSFPPAALLIWIGSLGLPFFLYRILSRSNRVAGGLSCAGLQERAERIGEVLRLGSALLRQNSDGQGGP